MRLPDFFSVQKYEGEIFLVLVEMWPGERCALQIQTRDGWHVQTILGINREQAQQRLQDAGYELVI